MKGKKLLCAAALACALLSPALGMTAEAKGSRIEKLIGGDVNGDGKVLSDDALLILRHSLGLYDFEGLAADMADVDNSGKVDSADALSVLRCSVGMAAPEGSIIGKTNY